MLTRHARKQRNSLCQHTSSVRRLRWLWYQNEEPSVVTCPVRCSSKQTRWRKWWFLFSVAVCGMPTNDREASQARFEARLEKWKLTWRTHKLTKKNLLMSSLSLTFRILFLYSSSPCTFHRSHMLVCECTNSNTQNDTAQSLLCRSLSFCCCGICCGLSLCYLSLPSVCVCFVCVLCVCVCVCVCCVLVLCVVLCMSNCTEVFAFIVIYVCLVLLLLCLISFSRSKRKSKMSNFGSCYLIWR